LALMPRRTTLSRKRDHLSGWLTTVIARVCLDLLRARRIRREDPVGDDLPHEIVGVAEEVDPEHQTILAESVGVSFARGA
jgi:RNA polymerase sigma-70 factor, ECF subfamily